MQKQPLKSKNISQTFTILHKKNSDFGLQRSLPPIKFQAAGQNLTKKWATPRHFPRIVSGFTNDSNLDSDCSGMITSPNFRWNQTNRVIILFQPWICYNQLKRFVLLTLTGSLIQRIFVTCCRKKDHPILRFQPHFDVPNLV